MEPSSNAAITDMLKGQHLVEAFAVRDVYSDRGEIQFPIIIRFENVDTVLKLQEGDTLHIITVAGDAKDYCLLESEDNSQCLYWSPIEEISECAGDAVVQIRIDNKSMHVCRIAFKGRAILISANDGKLAEVALERQRGRLLRPQ